MKISGESHTVHFRFDVPLHSPIIFDDWVPLSRREALESRLRDGDGTILIYVEKKVESFSKLLVADDLDAEIGSWLNPGVVRLAVELTFNDTSGDVVEAIQEHKTTLEFEKWLYNEVLYWVNRVLQYARDEAGQFHLKEIVPEYENTYSFFTASWARYRIDDALAWQSFEPSAGPQLVLHGDSEESRIGRKTWDKIQQFMISGSGTDDVKHFLNSALSRLSRTGLENRIALIEAVIGLELCVNEFLGSRFNSDERLSVHFQQQFPNKFEKNGPVSYQALSDNIGLRDKIKHGIGFYIEELNISEDIFVSVLAAINSRNRIIHHRGRILPREEADRYLGCIRTFVKKIPRDLPGWSMES